MSNYDSYLEAPYQAMYEESDRFQDWCDENEVDPDSPDAESLHQEWIDEQAELYAEYMLDRLEDRYEDRYDSYYED